MLEIYLICLFIGSVLIGFTLFGGHHDVDHGELHLPHDDAHFHGHPHGQSALAEAAQWLSLRNLIFFCAFFGLTGATLTWLGFSGALTLVTAVILGLFSAGLIHTSMKYLRRSESGAELHTESLKGCRAKVLIDVSREQRGKISVDVNGRILQLPAKVSEVATREGFRYGENVLIVDMDNGTAQIIEGDHT